MEIVDGIFHEKEGEGGLAQGCIFRLPCPHPELTKDHELTSAFVKT